MTERTVTLRDRIQKILDDQACIKGWVESFGKRERICTHDDHGLYMWPKGAVQCNGASDLLPLLRAALEDES